MRKNKGLAALLTATLAAASLGWANIALADDLAPSYTTQESGYTLVWNDEFEGTTLNSDNWNVEVREPG